MCQKYCFTFVLRWAKVSDMVLRGGSGTVIVQIRKIVLKIRKKNQNLWLNCILLSLEFQVGRGRQTSKC